MGTIYYPVNRRRPARSGASLFEQILLAVLAGFLIFSLALIGHLRGHAPVVCRAHLPRGDRGRRGRGRAFARAPPPSALTEQITYPQAGKIVLRDGDKIWVASPGELGTDPRPRGLRPGCLPAWGAAARCPSASRPRLRPPTPGWPCRPTWFSTSALPSAT